MLKHETDHVTPPLKNSGSFSTHAHRQNPLRAPEAESALPTALAHDFSASLAFSLLLGHSRPGAPASCRCVPNISMAASPMSLFEYYLLSEAFHDHCISNCKLSPLYPLSWLSFFFRPVVEGTICVIVSPTYHQRAWISVPFVHSYSHSTESTWPTVSIQYVFAEWKGLIPNLFSVSAQMSPPEGKSDTLILFSLWASPLLVL